MKRNILIEGIDGVGKTTQIQLLKDYCINNGYNPIIKHIGKPEPKDTIKERYEISKNYYSSFLKEINKNANEISNNVYIYDRSHIGEVVYSPFYRGYNGNYIFNLECDYCNDGITTDNTMVLLLDIDEKISIKRDKERGDDESFNLDIDKRFAERMSFLDSIRLTIFEWAIINCNNLSINQVHNEIITNINNVVRLDGSTIPRLNLEYINKYLKKERDEYDEKKAKENN